VRFLHMLGVAHVARHTSNLPEFHSYRQNKSLNTKYVARIEHVLLAACLASYRGAAGRGGRPVTFWVSALCS